jgi:hypothetical protein
VGLALEGVTEESAVVGGAAITVVVVDDEQPPTSIVTAIGTNSHTFAVARIQALPDEQSVDCRTGCASGQPLRTSTLPAMIGDGAEMRAMLRNLDPRAREAIRKTLIRDQPYRDAMSGRLMRERTEAADNLADMIDLLALDDDRRRLVVRLLGELNAEAG